MYTKVAGNTQLHSTEMLPVERPILQTQQVSPQTHHFPTNSDKEDKVLFFEVMAIVVGKIAVDASVSENAVYYIIYIYTLKK